MFVGLVYRTKMIEVANWWSSQVADLLGNGPEPPQSSWDQLEALAEVHREAALERIEGEPRFSELARELWLEAVRKPTGPRGPEYMSQIVKGMRLSGFAIFFQKLFVEEWARYMDYVLDEAHHEFEGRAYEFDAHAGHDAEADAKLLSRREEDRMFREELPRYQGARRRALEGIWKASMASAGDGERELGVALIELRVRPPVNFEAKLLPFAKLVERLLATRGSEGGSHSGEGEG